MFGLGKRKEPEPVVEDFEVQEWSEEDGQGVDMSQGMSWGDSLCAWCLAEQGITPDSNDSHGICAYHSQQMLGSHRARRSR